MRWMRLFFGLFLFLSITSFIEARSRQDYSIKGTYQDNGDTRDVFSFSIGTTTAVQVYFSTFTQNVNYRNSVFQNNSTSHRVYVGTHSALSPVSGARWFIPAGGSWTTKAREDTWMVFNTGLGAGTEELFLFLERDTLDASITDR